MADYCEQDSGPSISSLRKQEFSIQVHVEDLSVSVAVGDAPVPRIFKKVVLKARQIAGTRPSQPQTTDASEPKDGSVENITSILNNVSMTANPGQVCLVVGGSGSGKTTFLSTLAGRMNPGTTAVSGKIMFNDTKPKHFWGSSLVGYLQQEDYLLPYLTVRETLLFAADQRMPPGVSRQEKSAMVESLLQDHRLNTCADVRVGETSGAELSQATMHGISGGERRRLSAAVQFLGQPKLLLCDEVTSGLDAFAAFELVKSLKSYAESTNSTVILSIHQPRSEIYHLLANTDSHLFLLSYASVVYSGLLANVLPWFNSLGLEPCGDHQNPLDYVLDLSVIDYFSESSEQTTRDRCVMLATAWEKRDQQSFDLPDVKISGGSSEEPYKSISTTTSLATSPLPLLSLKSTIPTKTSLSENTDSSKNIPLPSRPGLASQTWTLIRRGWTCRLRSKEMLAEIFQSILTAVALSLLIGRPSLTVESIHIVTGVTFTIIVFQSVCTTIYIACSEAKKVIVYERESQENLYGSSAYTLSSILLSAPSSCLASFSGLLRYAHALMFVALFRHAYLTIIIACAVQMVYLSVCGFLMPPSLASPVIGWGRHIAYTNIEYSIGMSLWLTDTEVKSSRLAGMDQEQIGRFRHLTALLDIMRWRNHVQKTILQRIDFDMPPGELTAILGGSGSGKTTFLNAILKRNPPNFKTSGDVFFNGTKNPSLDQINSVCGYVRQFDGLLLSHLTVRETLRFAMDLSMSSSTTKQKRWEKVEDIIEIIGLRGCADTLIGDEEERGCSGGERRRVSIGMQLVFEPACLFLDEPTTGLDALSALATVRLLKRIADQGRTVVCAIHQPRFDIWNEFGNVLLLMDGGRIAYAGKARDAIDYFERAGYHIPELTNPPDFLVDTTSINTRTPELETLTRATVDRIAALYQEHASKTPQDLGSKHKEMVETQLGNIVPQHAGYFQGTRLLTYRNYKHTSRQGLRYFNRIFEPLYITLSIVIVYIRLDDSMIGIISRFTWVQQTIIISISGVSVNQDSYVRQRDIAIREILNGTYSTSSFLLAFCINEIPWTCISVIFATILNVVFCHLRTNAANLATVYSVILAQLITGETLGLIASTLLPNNSMDIYLSITLILIGSLMGGLITPPFTGFFYYINHANVFKYSLRALIESEMKDRLIHCTQLEQQRLSCLFSSANQIIATLKLESPGLAQDVICMFALTILYRIVAWAVLVQRVKYLRKS
ncbi:hypothetical protein BGW38_010390 [Lunasporangiospora selenospora]|uniref:ABC transporter domain-containing protein n=1 Tax=Lunasporangiospora selenospora TaxID=979761 RepID=A0A9P6KFJ1_9FUNG|nr:hypothetical protein BGW38_010390 [Lunasporangiospora selenospora]